MRAQLAVLSGEGSGKKYVIRVAQRFVVGRCAGVSIEFSDTAVSRRHAELQLSAGGILFITDLNSRNGTFLEGRRLEPRAKTRVLSGDTITIGGNVLCAKVMTDGTRRILKEEDTRRLSRDSKYEVIGTLGQGSYGRVYAARAVGYDEPVAIKIVTLDGGVPPEVLARSIREGETAMRLRSPYLVEAHDMWVSDHEIVLVMELINGPSLFDRLRSGALQLPEALNIAKQVAAGLAVVHAAGIVHRDLKPSNVLLGPDCAKISDFGCAKDSAAREDLTDSDLGLGSLPYVAPEQAKSAKRADERSDLYGLGATLFHMVAGQPPFRAKGAGVFRQILEVPPPPLTEARPGCPREVSDLVATLLAKNPDDRPQEAVSLVSELAKLREALVPSAKLRRVISDEPETATLPIGFYRAWREQEDDLPDEEGDDREDEVSTKDRLAEE